MTMKKTEISIAIVKNLQNLFLICLRPDGVHQGGKWEFPGGKVEKKETPEQGMCRELAEEVGLTATGYQLLEAKTFDYGDRLLSLHFYLVSQFIGEAHAKEGQAFKWVTKAQLQSYAFPEANRSVIDKILAIAD